MCVRVVSDGSGTRDPGFGEIVLNKLNKFFFIFAKFLPYINIFDDLKVERAPKAL